MPDASSLFGLFGGGGDKKSPSQPQQGGGMDFGYGALISALTDLGKTGYGIAREEMDRAEAGKRAEADAQSAATRLQAVVASDQRAARLLAEAFYDAQENQSRYASVSREAALRAVKLANTQALSLPPAAKQSRADAANKYALDRADEAMRLAVDVDSPAVAKRVQARLARSRSEAADAFAASLATGQLSMPSLATRSIVKPPSGAAGGSGGPSLLPAPASPPPGYSPPPSPEAPARQVDRGGRPAAHAERTPGLAAFLSKKLGPLPVYGWGIGGLALIAAGSTAAALRHRKGSTRHGS